MSRKRTQRADGRSVSMVNIELATATAAGGWAFALPPTRTTRRVPRGQVQVKGRPDARKSKG